MHEEISSHSENPETLPDPAAIAAEMASYHVADVVEALNALSPELAASVLEHIPLKHLLQYVSQLTLGKSRVP